MSAHVRVSGAELQSGFDSFRGTVAALESTLLALDRRTKAGRFIHPSVGQELPAYLVTRRTVNVDRQFSLYYRSHSWLLGLGVPPAALLRAIASAATGGEAGEGASGTMHLMLSPEVIDCNAVMGAQVGIAVGAALARAQRLTICVMGDGAATVGTVYESLNLAALLKCRLLIVVEDNGMTINTPTSAAYRASIPGLFRLFGIPCHGPLGQPATEDDWEACWEVVTAATNDAKTGPSGIVFEGPRLGGHCLGDHSDWDAIVREHPFGPAGTNTYATEAGELVRLLNDCVSIEE